MADRERAVYHGAETLLTGPTIYTRLRNPRLFHAMPAPDL